MRVLLINGPNLNLLGQREPDIYGNESLNQLEVKLDTFAKANSIELSCYQSNAEHEIIEQIHSALDQIDHIIINPAAFTHTSVAIRDALLGVNIPFIEVHLSNIYARETFRHKSYFSDIAQGVTFGFGTLGYQFALEAAMAYHKQ